MATATSSPRGWKKALETAECQRCGGFLVMEWRNEVDAVAWRCVQCGELIDPVILSNRQVQALGGMERDPEPSTMGKRG